MWTFFFQLLGKKPGLQVVSDGGGSDVDVRLDNAVSKVQVSCGDGLVFCSETSVHWGKRSLRAAGLGSPWQRRSLVRMGVRTINQLLEHSGPITSRSGKLVVTRGVFQSWKQAVRVADQLPPMRPLDVLLLKAVQRRSWDSLAASNSRSLHRDIIRFSLTTRGAKLLADHRLPTPGDVERWVLAAIQKRDKHPVRS
jgi:hypothetical protein